MTLSYRKSETGGPPYFVELLPRVILDSRRTRFSHLIAKFIAPFREIAHEHSDNVSVPQHIPGFAILREFD